jgi:hypothetical protein
MNTESLKILKFENQCRGSSKSYSLELCDPDTLFLVIYLNEFKSAHNRGTCTSIFIEELFTITKLWNQPGCPSTVE